MAPKPTDTTDTPSAEQTAADVIYTAEVAEHDLSALIGVEHGGPRVWVAIVHKAGEFFGAYHGDNKRKALNKVKAAVSADKAGTAGKPETITL